MRRTPWGGRATDAPLETVTNSLRPPVSSYGNTRLRTYLTKNILHPPGLQGDGRHWTGNGKDGYGSVTSGEGRLTDNKGEMVLIMLHGSTRIGSPFAAIPRLQRCYHDARLPLCHLYVWKSLLCLSNTYSYIKIPPGLLRNVLDSIPYQTIGDLDLLDRLWMGCVDGWEEEWGASGGSGREQGAGPSLVTVCLSLSAE